jgi:hypothetical protein
MGISESGKCSRSELLLCRTGTATGFVPVLHNVSDSVFVGAEIYILSEATQHTMSC